MVNRALAVQIKIKWLLPKMWSHKDLEKAPVQQVYMPKKIEAPVISPTES